MNLYNFQLEYSNEINTMYNIIKYYLKKNNISIFNSSKLYKEFVIYLYNLRHKGHILV